LESDRTFYFIFYSDIYIRRVDADKVAEKKKEE